MGKAHHHHAPVPGHHVSGQANKPLSKPPHALTSAQVLEEVKSNPATGLDPGEIQTRLAEYGPNELEQKAGVQPIKIFFEQVFNAMTLVLLLALAASFGIKAWVEGGILGAIILLNICIGFFQTLQAEKTMDSLRQLGSPTSRVFRGGKTITVQTAEVVPGDIVDLATGDSVPADIRLIEAVNLEADEALLTGESVPALKMPGMVFDECEGPGDRLNVVFSSTVITKGRGRGVVFATGMFTEIGLIAGAINSAEPRAEDQGPPSAWTSVKHFLRPVTDWLGEFFGLTVGTPLQKKLAAFFIYLFFFAVLCAIIVLGANNFQTSRDDVVIYAITTAIGTIPVSLLLVLTLTMAAGTKKMVERNVIVRNLSSLEALGGVTNICSDKTGTLTQGRMVTRKAWLPGYGTYSVDPTNDVYNPTEGKVTFIDVQPKDLAHSGEKETHAEPVKVDDEVASKPALRWYLNTASLANLATVEQSDTNSINPGQWKAKGAPTEIAIEVFASRFGWNRLELTEGSEIEWKHVAEFPFDSDVKKMTVLYEEIATGETHVFTKGAVERVLASCKGIAMGEETQPITAEIDADIHANMERLAGQGLRVLALAHKVNPTRVAQADPEKEESHKREDFECDLVFRGLIGIYDPPRPESLPSVRACQGAGIVVHMLTGDHPETARAIAVEVGIMPSREKTRLLPAEMLRNMSMAAHDFDALTDAEIDAMPELPLVVARCAPSTKVRMIEALHRRGKYCAMTGDGVNDSPSLKRADIGIAMGTGSDVAKESADIILTDDNFTSILNAIEEGRRIFDNIQKFILHVMAANVGFVTALLIGLAFKDKSGVSIFQLTPVEIIWMFLGTGAFCETGLGFEKAVPDILNRPPQNRKYGVFTPEFVVDTFVYGIFMAVCVLGSFTVVVFGFESGNLGHNCNIKYEDDCNAVFRARATCFSVMTFIFLLFAWELIDFRRSFFSMPNGVSGWYKHLWGNTFLFWAVVLPFAMVFPVLYIPGLNRVVFLHTGITWEWAVVFIVLGVFMGLAEAYKWSKRVYFRRRGFVKPVVHSDEESV